MLYSLAVFSLLLATNTLASHQYSKRIPQPTENETDHNNVQDSGDVSLSVSSVFGAPFAQHRDSYNAAAPFSKQFLQKPRASLRAPINKRLQKERLLDDKADITGGSSVGYILTAGGAEKIYDGEGEAKIAPRTSPFATSSRAKKLALDKSLKKSRFAYANLGANGPSLANGAGDGSSSTATSTGTVGERGTKDAATAGTPAPDTAAVSRTLDASHAAVPHSATPTTHHKFYTESTDLYGSKGTAWKQLGPNIEISSATNHVPFTRQINSAKERKKSKTSAQQRKNGLKNVRTGFMTTQQHALYVANNLKGSNFDHGNVLRQSDKFEVTDAMISEAQRAEALKNMKTLRVRFREDVPYSSQSQPMPFQSADQLDASAQLPQYYSQTNGPFSSGAGHGIPALALSAFPSQLGTLGRGFIQHIQVEMNGAGGARKMVPALIIPLAAEAAAYNYVNSEAAAAPAAAFVNHSDRQSKPSFAYDIVAPRYVHHHADAINAIASSASDENYHLQPFAQLHYQYKTQLADDSSYNPYVSPHYHNHNLYNTRFAFINSNGGGATTVSGNNGETQTMTNGGATLAAHDKRSSRHSAPKSGAHTHHHSAKKALQHLIGEQSEQKAFTSSPYVTSIATFVYDADNTATGTAQTYLAPSESSYFATMASTRDEARSGQPAKNNHIDKSNVRRDT